jgi:hypothetical protein
MPHAVRVLCRTTSCFLLLAVTGCVWLFRGPTATELTPGPNATIRVRTPVKAHLTDGSTIFFPRGVTVSGDSILGAGTHYGLTLADSAPVSSVPRSRVAAMSRFDNHYDSAGSFAVSLLASALAFLVGVSVAFAIGCGSGGCD